MKQLSKVLIFLSLSVFAASSFAQTKMAFVDLHKVVQSSTAGRKVRAELEAQFTTKKRELDAREAKLKAQEQELEKLKGKVSAENYNKRVAQFEKQMLEFRDFSARTQFDFQNREMALTTPVLEKIRRVITRVSKEAGYTVVLEKTAQVLYSPEADDLTARVVREFEKEK